MSDKISDGLFETWFKSVEAGDNENWQIPKYLSTEWDEYLLRRQLALGAWKASRAADAQAVRPVKLNVCAEMVNNTLMVPLNDLIVDLLGMGIAVTGRGTTSMKSLRPSKTLAAP